MSRSTAGEVVRGFFAGAVGRGAAAVSVPTLARDASVEFHHRWLCKSTLAPSAARRAAARLVRRPGRGAARIRVLSGHGSWPPRDRTDVRSPNTIATAIAGLICAADIARKHGDKTRAARYETIADDWQAKVQAWTATTNGPYSQNPYYLRLTKDANPDDGSTYNLGDNFAQNPIDERRVIDQSFLGLVLFGAKRHNDPTIRNSLAVGDRELKVNTPHGPVWHRFTFDGYGETASGADWTIFPTAANQTLGRGWPLLTGERGEYELLAGNRAQPYLAAIAATANDGLMLPEQVWDGRPPTGTPGHPFGEGTRSATPLAWTHAQYIRLAWSIDAGTPIARPSIVACRYTGTSC